MKRLLLVATLVLATTSQAAEVWIGTIVATTTKNNSDTAVPFTIPPKTKLMIECDVAAYIGWGASASTTVTTANGHYMNASWVSWDTSSTGTLVYLAAVSVSGTVTCKVFRVQAP